MPHWPFESNSASMLERSRLACKQTQVNGGNAMRFFWITSRTFSQTIFYESLLIFESFIIESTFFSFLPFLTLSLVLCCPSFSRFPSLSSFPLAPVLGRLPSAWLGLWQMGWPSCTLHSLDMVRSYPPLISIDMVQSYPYPMSICR